MTLDVELARAQRLVKGHGETHERGWRSFNALAGQLDALAARADGAAVLARFSALQEGICHPKMSTPAISVLHSFVKPSRTGGKRAVS